jgi:Domain of unknown function (DUF4124)
MKRTLFFALAVAFAALSFVHQSFAQQYQYKWIDKDGKTQYGDIPPPGVKATPVQGSAAPARAPAAESKPAAKDAKAAAKGPLTPAEQEAEFRKRQIEAQKGREKDEKTAQERETRRANCSNAQDQVRSLESGQRISRTDAKGERYFIEDAERAADLARARKAASEWCSG